MKFRSTLLLPALFALALLTDAQAAELKIGFVNSERVLREAGPVIKAQKKLEQEFSKREQELRRMEKQLADLRDSVEKNAVTMGETERRGKEKETADLTRELQRRQREFREDVAQRRNEELAQVVERANKIIRSIAEQEKFDLILQEAVFAGPRIDITDRVIKALGDSR